MGIFSRAQRSGPQGEELRRCRRYQIEGEHLEASWLDARGKMRMARAKVLNVSEGGIALLIPELIETSLLRFTSTRLDVNGLGTIKHCHRLGFKYVVGLEFGSNVRWQAPEGEVQEPISLCSP
jgi:hypothetical protein